MKKILITTLGAAAMIVSASVAQAQGSGIPVQKDAPGLATTPSYPNIEFVGEGYRLRPGTAPIYCSSNDAEEVAKVAIKQDLYTQGMITPEQAKAVALCAVPGQLTSGEMETRDGRTVYQITLIPRDKQTHSKVEIDARTGEVLNAQQMGGLRGLAGFLRESVERDRNKQQMSP